MISFYGDENDLVTQRLLGSVVRTLHAQPQLTRDNIRQAILHGPAFLAPSNLADDVELVKFSPLHLSLEELSKIWSIFYQIPYTLSVAYQATVVLIETDDMPFHTLPVRRRNIYTVPFQQPTIDRVGTTDGDDVPIDIQSTLRIRGRNLKGNITVVQIDGLEVVPDVNSVSNTEITLVLADVEKQQITQPPVHLQAGVQGVQVIHRFLMGMDTPDKPLEAHHGVESNVAAFVLRPRITSVPQNVAGSGVLTVEVEPAVSKTQRAVLLLNEVSPNLGQRLDHPARRYTFDKRIINENDPEPNTTLTFSVKDVVAGTYLVRVQVDGAESLLDVDTTDPKSPTFNTYVGGPKVSIS